MVSGKLALVSNSRTLIFLVGLTICYQLVYHVMMHHALPHADGAQCSNDLASSSPECLEMQLFRSWKKAELDEHRGFSDNETEEDLEFLVYDRMKKALPQAITTSSQPLIAETTSAAAEYGNDSQEEHVQLDKTYSNWTVSLDHSIGLQDMQMDLKRESTGARHAFSLQWQEEFDKLYNETLAIIRDRNYTSPWATELANMQTYFEAWDRNLSRARTHTKSQDVSNAKARALRGASTYIDRLKWSSVVASVAAKATGQANRSTISVLPESLRFQKWQGKIPKVACITVVTAQDAPRARMRYFIDNFQLQSYEGPRQLVLVYRHTDTEVANLVKKYADGTYIKAVAARESGEFPSTASFRYGAWSADADVIARWSFDEWHHPQRLSMQVRALALTSRPVSLLKQWTVRKGTGNASEMTLSGEPGWLGSIVGDATWMQQHWMPLLEGERDLLQYSYAHDIVQVDMPELSVYTAKHSDEWEDVLRHFGLAKPQITDDKVSSTCNKARVATSMVLQTNHSNLSADVASRVGSSLGKEFDMLVSKQLNIAEMLQSLCAEAEIERSPSRRNDMLKKINQMTEIHEQISEHFGVVKSIFGSESNNTVSWSDSYETQATIAVSPCHAGQYDHLGTCEDCAVGRYSSSQGATECQACEPGMFSSTAGATECIADGAFGSCQSTDGAHTDAYGDNCTTYQQVPTFCGQFDDDDFESGQMCCACGGGVKK